jgi:hypothetical protein
VNSRNGFQGIAIWLAGALFPFVGSYSVAQGTASISGTVTDAFQSAVTERQIALTNTSTGQARVNTSSDRGYIDFPDLQPGVYSAAVDKSGFRLWRQSSITLAVAQHITVYPLLHIGSAGEQVVITAEPTFLTTDDSTLSGVVEAVGSNSCPRTAEMRCNWNRSGPRSCRPARRGSWVRRSWL